MKVESVQDAELFGLIKNSLIKMYGMGADKMAGIMNAETWLDSSDCIDAGFIDKKNVIGGVEVDETTAADITTAKAARDLNAVLCIYNKLNSANDMFNVLNVLGIDQKTGKEADAVSKITEIQNSLKDATAKVETLEAVKVTATADLKAANEKITAFEVANKAITDKAAADLKVAAKELVAQAVKDLKIENEATVIASWEDLAEKNFDSVKNAFAGMGKKAAKVTIENVGGDIKPITAGNVMAEIDAKTRNK